MADLAAALRAALADRYRIERELGAGGMATVYLARDLKHERDVALKVMRPDLAAVLGSERFLAEIKITARLDHPHILTLIDSGESDGFLYYVLPLVRGESLRDKLNREQQLSLEDALSITRQVASALDYAHRQGVVHRDIKPENILFQEGEAMLTDFGIALAVTEAAGNRLTMTGLSLGTPQYMSPEQATGARNLDARSDVYSLGAVLYEMLAGEPPVTGPTAQAMIAKLLTERPVHLKVVRHAVPEGIDAAVSKALEKTPADRFAGAAEFVAALTAGKPKADPAPRGRPAIGWLVLAAVLVTAGIVWAVVNRGTPRTSPVSFLTTLPTKLTASGQASGGVPSPDGSLIVYTERRCTDGACRGDLVNRETSSEGISTVVSMPGHSAIPRAWSPDGRWVAFDDLDRETGVIGGLYLVSQRGGVPRLIAAGALSQVGFVAPDTIVLMSHDSLPHQLRRVVASTGTVVDSIRLPVGRYVNQFYPSPDGARLLVRHQDQRNGDPAMVSVVDRTGHATDSLRLDCSCTSAFWGGGSDVVVLGIQQPDRLTVVRHRLDGTGRFLPGADTLRTLAEKNVMLLGASADGTQLFYEMTRLGEFGLWTATRSGARGGFTRGRKIRSGSPVMSAWVSPGGKWLLLGTAEGTLLRLEVQPFAGGESHIVDPTVRDSPSLAFSPSDDSVAAIGAAGTGGFAITIYPLAAGAPVRRETFVGAVGGLEWLSDGRFATVVESPRVVRVLGRKGEVQDLPIPDSLGTLAGAARSPSAPELALLSVSRRGDRSEVIVSRVNLTDGRFTPVARTGSFSSYGADVFWTTDGWVHVRGVGPGDERERLYRAPIRGGAFQADSAVGFESNGWVYSLSLDGRRAVVRVQTESTDLWVLRAERPK